jgi:ABC-type multidrug transport system fused ATPase/permease subunit
MSRRSAPTLLSDGVKIGVGVRTTILILLLQLATSAFELMGLVSFVPVFQFLGAGGNVAGLTQDHAHWRTLAGLAAKAGLEVNLALLLTLTLVMFLLRQVLGLIRTLFEAASRERATAALRARLFRRFLSATTDYQDRATSGGMVTDLTFNSTHAAGHVFGRIALATQLAICLVYLSGMLSISLLMTSLLLGVVATAVLVAAPQVLKARQHGREVVDTTKGVAEFIVERLNLARLVRISGMEDREAATIDELSRRQGNANIQVWRSLSLVDSSLETIAVIIGLAIVYLAITFFGLTIELVGVFLAMLTRLIPVVRQVVKMKQAADAARASFDAVVDRLSDLDANTEQRKGGGIHLDRPHRTLTLDKVTYRYPTRPDHAILSDVSLNLPVGTMTAIVGPSGAGKSTLIDLLPRLRIPQSGRVMIDGRNIADFELGEVRRAIAYLSQKPLIFNVPLREHIAYGTPAASQEAIETAARLAGIHETIASLPEGYDTPAGEGGGRLSGGQRQRLDLARALLSEAPILILDEPTASLDGASGHELIRAIERIRQNTRTTIVMISHHLPSVRSADQIAVLRDGRIEAVGKHDELMRTDGWYPATWRIQMTAEAAEATSVVTPAA